MRTSSQPSRGSGGGSSSNAPGPDVLSILAGFCLTLGVGGWYVVILTAFRAQRHSLQKKKLIGWRGKFCAFSILYCPLCLLVALQLVFFVGLLEIFLSMAHLFDWAGRCQLLKSVSLRHFLGAFPLSGQLINWNVHYNAAKKREGFQHC